MRQHTAMIAFFLFGGPFALGLVALASMLGSGASQADDATMHNCPQPSRWAVAVWGGDDETGADQAFATCGEGAVVAAYDLDPQTQGWSRWFADQPAISTLSTLDKWQGVIALGGAEVAASPTPSPSPTPTPTLGPSPTPTPIVFTGTGDKNTPLFSVAASSFTVSWTTHSDSPEWAGLWINVYPEGETLWEACEAQFDGVGSDSTICYAGPGKFWIEVGAANLSSWRIEVSGPPPVSSLPAVFTGSGDKNTPLFSVATSSFTVSWTTQSDSPEWAGLWIDVYPEGETLWEACEAQFDGVGSDSTICYAGPGKFWIEVGAANLSSWRIEVSG
jgi:hypothetical protein